MNKVLIIDNSKSESIPLANELKKTYGIDTEVVDTHQEGLSRFIKNKEEYAAILMEIMWMIPEDFSDDEKRESNEWMNTGAVIKNKIRKENIHIPIVFYTSQAFSKNMNADANTRYFRKPELPEVIAKALLEVMNDQMKREASNIS